MNRKTPRKPADWSRFANRDSLQDLQDMHDLEQARAAPSPDPMQGAVDAQENALAATRARKASEWAATEAIEKARASARERH